MTIFFNNTPISVEQDATIEKILQAKGLRKPEGIAVALNSKVVSKEEWSKTTLQPNDMLLIIGAYYGG